jgi:RimJ/RimL family protein N-acetyltransferase
MTSIRSIAPGELPVFTSVAGPDHATDQAAYVSDMIERGTMRPEWCFVAEQDGRIVGRYGYWTLPSLDHPEWIVLLDVAPGVHDPDADAVATELLAHALAGARKAGSPTLGLALDEPPQWPQWQDDPDRRAGWLEAAGFRVRRETLRFELQAADAVVPPDADRLTFRDLETVGEAAFLDAIERVSAASLDQITRDERDRLGPAAEAQQMLDELRTMVFEPSWWELAFDADGALVGLVMPAGAPTFVSIGYIGVVPGQRGRRYVDDLLARGTATLLRIGKGQVIRVDTDTDNAPMAAAFERAGYRRFATRREFEIRL